jgi:hypothetical protein
MEEMIDSSAHFLAGRTNLPAQRLQHAIVTFDTADSRLSSLRHCQAPRCDRRENATLSPRDRARGVASAPWPRELRKNLIVPLLDNRLQ